MLAFYRELDLLNRLYILNYCKLELLEATFIAQIPNELSVLDLKPAFSFDLNDKILLLSGLPTKRIKSIVDKVILEVLSESSATAVNGVLLRNLVNYFSDSDFNKLINQGSRMRGAKLNHTGTSISKYKIIDVFYHFVAVIFQDVSKKLQVDILERFISDYRLDDNLLTIVNKLPLQKLLGKVINTHIPFLNMFSTSV